MSKQVLDSSELVVRLASYRELHLVALGCQRCYDRKRLPHVCHGWKRRQVRLTVARIDEVQITKGGSSLNNGRFRLWKSSNRGRHIWHWRERGDLLLDLAFASLSR
jgi:hypothetical protein